MLQSCSEQTNGEKKFQRIFLSVEFYTLLIVIEKENFGCWLVIVAQWQSACALCK